VSVTKATTLTVKKSIHSVTPSSKVLLLLKNDNTVAQKETNTVSTAPAIADIIAATINMFPICGVPPLV
jgi:hypothetical protein